MAPTSRCDFSVWPRLLYDAGMNERSVWLSVALTLAAALFALTPSAARAGSCPTCTTSADCTAFEDGGVAFCVLHASDVGCGGELQICCPGQGCNTISGRSSCEGTTCTVVDGAPDAGPAESDAGPSAADAGAADDAGISVMGDAATPPPMDGGTPMMTETSSCSCRVGEGRSQGAAGLGALLLLAALTWRRRRAR